MHCGADPRGPAGAQPNLKAGRWHPFGFLGVGGEEAHVWVIVAVQASTDVLRVRSSGRALELEALDQAFPTVLRRPAESSAGGVATPRRLNPTLSSPRPAKSDCDDGTVENDRLDTPARGNVPGPATRPNLVRYTEAGVLESKFNFGSQVRVPCLAIARGIFPCTHVINALTYRRTS